MSIEHWALGHQYSVDCKAQFWTILTCNIIEWEFASHAYRQPTGNGLTIRLRRLPQHSHRLYTWNVHDASLTGSSRTNNVCESWNNSYRNLIGHAQPCVWTSIDAVRKDQAAASTTLYQQRSGQLQRKRVRRERTHLQQQLKQLCKECAARWAVRCHLSRPRRATRVPLPVAPTAALIRQGRAPAKRGRWQRHHHGRVTASVNWRRSSARWVTSS